LGLSVWLVEDNPFAQESGDSAFASENDRDGYDSSAGDVLEELQEVDASFAAEGEAPAPNPAEAGVLGADRKAAGNTIHLRLPGLGAQCRVSWYGTEKPFFETHCPNPAHGKCVRTCSAFGNASRPAQGRCLGLAAAWVNCADQPSKAEHMQVRPDCFERYIARLAFREEYGNEWKALEAKERPRRSEEDEEPEMCP